MMQQNIPEGRDPHLWELAQRRAAFKRHLATYVVVISFLWILWYLTNHHEHDRFPWPVWPMFGWGIAIALQYFGAYVNTGYGSTEKEYENLEQQRSFKK